MDVNINTEDGLRAIDAIKEYMDKMPALKPIVLLVKALLAPRSLNSAATLGLGSYTLVCMVISFLQVRSSMFRLHCLTGVLTDHRIIS